MTSAIRSAATSRRGDWNSDTSRTQQMTDKEMTPEELYEFYKHPANLEPQGPALRLRGGLTEMVPVRFTAQMLEVIRQLANAEDRPVSWWIRRAVERDIERQSGDDVE